MMVNNFKRLLESFLNENVLTKLEKTFKIKIKKGRNSIDGYPFDIEDQDPEEGLEITPVDKDAVKGLSKILKKKGFKIESSKEHIVILEGFETTFFTALSNVKQQDDTFMQGDLEDERFSAKMKKNLEHLVKILNKKVDQEFTKPQYYTMAKRLFNKAEAERILNHFVRRKVITGAYEGSKMMYSVIRKIERQDFRNFY